MMKTGQTQNEINQTDKSIGEEMIDFLENDVSNDQQLKKLLSVVWQNNISDAVWLRIKNIADKTW